MVVILSSCLQKTARHFVSFLTDATVREMMNKKKCDVKTDGPQDGNNDERTDDRTNGRRDKRMNERRDKRMNERTDEWTKGQTDEWTEGLSFSEIYENPSTTNCEPKTNVFILFSKPWPT